MTIRQQIIAWMRANPGDHAAGEIYDGIGATDRAMRASVSKTLNKMLRFNDVARVARNSRNEGVYALCPHADGAAPRKHMSRAARVGIRAANTPRQKSTPTPALTSEDFIRAGGKIEVLPSVTYVAPRLAPVKFAA